MKHTTRTATAVLALATTLTLGGCIMPTPADPGPQKTGQQLRAQLIADTTAAIAASGLPDGWAYHPVPDADPWNPGTDEFIGASCSTSNGETRERFQVFLYHAPVGDPAAFVHMMGDYWNSQGYIVSTVVPTITKPGGGHLTANRADRTDRTLAAGATAHDKYFVLNLYTECSTDPTLGMFAGPTGYRTFDDLDPNPYHPTNSPTVTPYPQH